MPRHAKQRAPHMDHPLCYALQWRRFACLCLLCFVLLCFCFALLCLLCVPCRAVPCRAVPCRAVPCRAVPCRCAVLCCAVLCCASSLARLPACLLYLLVSAPHTPLASHCHQLPTGCALIETATWVQNNTDFPHAQACVTQDAAAVELSPLPRDHRDQPQRHRSQRFRELEQLRREATGAF